MFLKKNLDNPLFNLNIFLSCNKNFFHSSELLHTSIEQLAMYQKAYESALNLAGPNFVTERGHIIRGFINGLPERRAELDIGENIIGLLYPERRFRTNECNPLFKDVYASTSVHIHYDDGDVNYITKECDGYRAREVKLSYGIERILKKQEEL